MKKVLLCALSLCLILSGCAANQSKDTETNKSEDVSSGGKKEKYEVIESIEPIIVESPEYTGAEASYDGVNREVLAGSGDLKMDYISLPNIEGLTDEQIGKAINSDAIKLSMVADPNHMGKGAKKALKLEFTQNITWGQTILAYELDEPLANGLKEGILLDPVDESLEAYQGIRFYVDFKRPAGREYSLCKLRFMFGSFSNYRSIYEYSYVMPDGDYKGYIDIPFDQMKNGYNQKTGVSVKKIDYFGFNVSLEGSIEGAEVYLSDFQAYREMFW